MTPQDFIKKWKPVALTERATAHTHFKDLCARRAVDVLTSPTDGVYLSIVSSVCSRAAGEMRNKPE
jgi:L-alanine-DL-glutamate epimerase-like enolase superfamily enzyme